MLDSKLCQNLPQSPGVYLFKDKNNAVLYVGKAINLKKRVKNYFEKIKSENRINLLLKKANKIDFILVNSEIEALLLEAKLVKQYQPKFNVRLKDDKRYLYAGISKEKFPRIFLLRKPEKTKQLLAWFGPFPSASSIKEILRLLRRVFPYRSCERMPPKVCLYYHLNLCPGMCQFPVKEKEYFAGVRKIKLFLAGKISFLIAKLEKEMKQFAQNLEFEEAQKIRQQILMIENMLGKFKKMPEEEENLKALNWLRQLIAKYQKTELAIIHRLEAYDIANLGKKVVVGSMVVFINGEPQPEEYRQFNIRAKSGGDPWAIEEVILRRLNHKEWLYPQLILVDGGKTQVTAAFKVLKNKNLIGQIGFLGLAKKEEKIIIPIIRKGEIKNWKVIGPSRKSLGFLLLQRARDEAHRFAQRYYKKLYQKATFSFEQE